MKYIKYRRYTKYSKYKLKAKPKTKRRHKLKSKGCGIFGTALKTLELIDIVV